MSEPGITISQLQGKIRDSIMDSLPDGIWITGEISEIRVNNTGHAYLEMIEKGEDENVIAKVRAVIWSRKARMIMPYFETTAGIPLKEGIKILVRATVNYHQLYGLNLDISDIDPLYSAGEVAVRRREIVNRLENEGVLNMNSETIFPLFPGRIAVISSGTAAGYGDFLDHLTNNAFGYCFSVSLFQAAMQGHETKDSVVAALNNIFNSVADFDIVVIVRGGGAQSDLGWFDNYDIAYTITQCPLPVLCGIGHERDITVTDMVSFSSLKTPTAVADFIIEATAGTEMYIKSLGQKVAAMAKDTIRSQGKSIDRLVSGIAPSATRLVSSGLQKLATGKQRLISGIKRIIEMKLSMLDYTDKTVQNMSPEKVLARGYSITLSGGKPARDVSELTKGDEIITLLHKGKLKSKIFDINN